MEGKELEDFIETVKKCDQILFIGSKEGGLDSLTARVIGSPVSSVFMLKHAERCVNELLDGHTKSSQKDV